MKFPSFKDYPKEIRINNEIYKIKWVKYFKYDFNCKGTCEPGLIKIKKGQTDLETFLTFIHEVLHALEFEYSLPLKHKLVHKLEIPISNFFTHNF